MADLSDVENALVAAISATIYPNGTSEPSAINVDSVNISARIYPGLPIPDNLDSDLAAGNIVNISCYGQIGLEKNTTRYDWRWQNQFSTTPTITAVVSGNKITIGGTITVGHYVTIVAGNAAYSYAALESDTLDTVATALAALINANTPASASGAVVTVAATNSGVLVARVGAPNTSMRELERTNQRFQVAIWAPTNAIRAATAKIIRPALGAINTLAYPDNTCGRIFFECSYDLDRSAKQTCLVREIYYWIEYPTVEIMTSYPITAPVFGIELLGPNSPDFTPLPWTGEFTPTITVNT